MYKYMVNVLMYSFVLSILCISSCKEHSINKKSPTSKKIAQEWRGSSTCEGIVNQILTTSPRYIKLTRNLLERTNDNSGISYGVQLEGSPDSLDHAVQYSMMYDYNLHETYNGRQLVVARFSFNPNEGKLYELDMVADTLMDVHCDVNLLDNFRKCFFSTYCRSLSSQRLPTEVICDASEVQENFLEKYTGYIPRECIPFKIYETGNVRFKLLLYGRLIEPCYQFWLYTQDFTGKVIDSLDVSSATCDNDGTIRYHSRTTVGSSFSIKKTDTAEYYNGDSMDIIDSIVEYQNSYTVNDKGFIQNVERTRVKL